VYLDLESSLESQDSLRLSPRALSEREKWFGGVWERPLAGLWVGTPKAASVDMVA